MISPAVISFILLAGPVLHGLAANIPESIMPCRRRDPHLEDCILSAVEKLRAQLKVGIPELHVPPLEPLLIDTLHVALGSGFKATGHDVIVHGASRFKVTAFKVDLKNLVFDVSIELPSLQLSADYDIDARIFNFPVKGHGPISANATQILGDVRLRGELRGVKPRQVLHMVSVAPALTIADFKVDIKNLFPGDSMLNDATSGVVNANSKELLVSVLPVIERTVADLLLGVANNITAQFYYDDIFPA